MCAQPFQRVVLVFLLCPFLSTILSFQSQLQCAEPRGELKGIVINQATGAPAAGVILTLAHAVVTEKGLEAFTFEGKSAVTDASGSFHFSKLSARKYGLALVGPKGFETLLTNKRGELLCDVKEDSIADFGILEVEVKPEHQKKLPGHEVIYRDLVGTLRLGSPLKIKDNKLLK